MRLGSFGVMFLKGSNSPARRVRSQDKYKPDMNLAQFTDAMRRASSDNRVLLHRARNNDRSIRGSISGWKFSEVGIALLG